MNADKGFVGPSSVVGSLRARQSRHPVYQTSIQSGTGKCRSGRRTGESIQDFDILEELARTEAQVRKTVQSMEDDRNDYLEIS